MGLQAQDVAAARLGVRARSGDLAEADVVAATEQRRSVVRTWLMRATVHLVAAEDVHWMVALFGPMIERRFANVRWRQLGIDGPTIETATEQIVEVLQGRQLTRHQIAAELADRGVRLAEDGQAATHLLLALSCRGITCRARDQGRESTFALLDEWIPLQPRRRTRWPSWPAGTFGHSGRPPRRTSRPGPGCHPVRRSRRSGTS